MRRHLLIPAVIVAVFFAGCSKTIDSDKAERTIERLVASKIGTQVQRVECPTDKTAKTGQTFTCPVMGNDGSAAEAVVTATDDEGTVRVTARILPTDETERSLAAELTTRRRQPVGVDCQDIIVVRTGVAFDCVTSSGEAKGRVRARIVDDEGRVRYRTVKGS